MEDEGTLSNKDAPSDLDDDTCDGDSAFTEFSFDKFIDDVIIKETWKHHFLPKINYFLPIHILFVPAIYLCILFYPTGVKRKDTYLNLKVTLLNKKIICDYISCYVV